MMNKLFTLGAGAALVLALLAGDATAQGRGRGHSKDKGKDKGSDDARVTVVFRDNDHAKYQDYFVAHKIVASPLPPGIAMNIARGKPLPPGIAKRALPSDFVVLMPRDPSVTYYVVGDRVVAVRRGNVIDVLLNVFR